MAIKLPNPGNGIPEQKTGNDEWTNMKIVRDNFADQTHAASRLIGSGVGAMSLNEKLFKAAHANLDIVVHGSGAGYDCNSAQVGDVVRVNRSGNFNLPMQTYSSSEWIIIYTSHESSGKKVQFSRGFDLAVVDMFTRTTSSDGVSWSAWMPMNASRHTYYTTTAIAPNVVIEADGIFKRSSSSIKYKEVVAPLELDDESYRKALTVKPIIYRSKADADPKNWHFMSFVAEELGEIDPALTQWRTHGVKEETGEWGELEQKEAEGINLNAICAVLHATNIYQDKKLKELEQRLKVLEKTDEPAI